MSWGWRISLEITKSSSLLRAESARAGCSESCAIEFWISPRTETPQLQWAACSSVCPPSQWRSFLLCWSGVSYVSVCDHWLLFCPWAKLRVWHCCLYFHHPVFIHVNEHSFSRLSSSISQPVLIWQMLQSPNGVHGPSVGLDKYVPVSFVLKSSALDSAFQLCLTRAEYGDRTM